MQISGVRTGQGQVERGLGPLRVQIYCLLQGSQRPVHLFRLEKDPAQEELNVWVVRVLRGGDPQVDKATLEIPCLPLDRRGGIMVL